MKKRVLSLLFAVLMLCGMASVLSGCGGGGGDKPSSGNSGDIQGKDLLVVSFTDLGLDNEGTAYNNAKKHYESTTGGKVKYRQYHYSVFITKMITLIGSGNSPDLAYCRYAEMPKLGAMEILQPVDDYIKPEETNYPLVAEAYSLGDKHYALRVEQVQPYMVWYNKQILQEYGCDDGLEFGDAELVEAVYRTYVNSILRHNCSPSGWAPHDLGKLRFPDGLGDPYGDHASCADIAYVAFLLATRGGHPELLDDTERFIRARLFRCQVQAGTEQGAWGTYGGYFGVGVVMDVFALIAGTLAILYRDSVEEKEDSLWVHLHFSQECEPAQVTAYRDTHQHLNVVPTRAQTVRVRIPGWCDVATLRVTDPEGQGMPYTLEGGYAVISAEAVKAGRAIAVSFHLPVTETVEYTTVSHTGYRLRWKGDEITAVDELS